MTEAYTEEYRPGHPPLAPGEILAPGYEIVEHLHQSNNFDVYDVFSEERACSCIDKVPRGDLVESAKVGRSLVREGRLLRKLTHPHLVRSYETIKEGPYPVLILETLTGETLAHLIDTGSRRLPVSDVAHLGLHRCSAIHYLHRHNILHLDLKPSNIVSERQMAKILDLSIARRDAARRAWGRTNTCPRSMRAATTSVRRPTCGASGLTSTRQPPASTRSTPTKTTKGRPKRDP